MIYYMNVTLTQSGIDWAHEVPIPSSMTEEEYEALADKVVFVRDGYTIDLSEGTSTGFAYDDIVGRTVNQIRGLFPAEGGEYDHSYANVSVSGDSDFTIIGSSAGEILSGGSGNDTLYDGGNAGFEYEFDSLHGGAGDDTYYVTGVDTSVIENAGEGFDRVFADGFFYLQPNTEVEWIQVGGDFSNVYGNNFANIMIGSDQSSTISGGGGNDDLRSGGGNTVFEGGVGNDLLRGGVGVDIFVYYGDDKGRDTISQFGDEDVLVTTNKIYDSNNDGIIGFGPDKKLDFSSGSSARMTDVSGATIKSLEYDGSYTSESGVIYYVYSRVGSEVGADDSVLKSLIDSYYHI